MENLHKVSVHHQSKWWVRASSEQSLRDFHDCSLSTKVHFRGWLGNAVSLWSRSFSHLVLPRWNCYSLRDGSKQGGAEFFFIVRFPFKLSAVLISKYHTAISPVVCRKVLNVMQRQSRTRFITPLSMVFRRSSGCTPLTLSGRQPQIEKKKA